LGEKQTHGGRTWVTKKKKNFVGGGMGGFRQRKFLSVIVSSKEATGSHIQAVSERPAPLKARPGG